MDYKLSIVIVHWRTPELLRRCLLSLQEDKGIEQGQIYVVDNASGDETLDLLAEQFPFVKVLANSENIGFSKACNQIIPITASLFVLLLNPDTIVKEQAITKLLAFMEAYPECGAVGPKSFK